MADNAPPWRGRGRLFSFREAVGFPLPAPHQAFKLLALGVHPAAELIKQLGRRELSPNKTYRLTVQYAVLFWVNGFSANNIVGFVGGNARQFKSLVGPLDGSHYKVYNDDYYFYIKTDVNTGLTLCPFGYFGDLEIEETDVDVSGLVLLQ